MMNLREISLVFILSCQENFNFFIIKVEFSNLKTLVKQHDFKFQRPIKVICDFEIGLQCILIALLKSLIHITNENDRKRMWEEICAEFKEPELANLLEYFQTHWLNYYSINVEDSNGLHFRTNNICESYNSKLSKCIGVRKPQFGLLLDKLLELENRYTHLDKINNGKNSQILKIDKEQYLFPSFTDYLITKKMK